MHTEPKMCQHSVSGQSTPDGISYVCIYCGKVLAHYYWIEPMKSFSSRPYVPGPKPKGRSTDWYLLTILIVNLIAWFFVAVLLGSRL